MENNFETYYLEIASYSKEQLDEYAYKSFAFVNNQIKKQLTNDDSRLNLMLDILECFLIVDGPVNEAERDLFCKITGYPDLSVEDLNKICATAYAEQDKHKDVLAILKKNSEDVRDGLFFLGACLAAIDGEINVKEQKYIEEFVRVDIGK